jgi:NADPH:quinone reductase-like Zn-dependent oxidoreductase
MNQADLRRAITHFADSETVRDAAIGGLEMAGSVIGLGSEVTGFDIGDRVMAMTGRSWAEQVTVDYRLAIRVPERFSWREAGATPISFMTAHDALVSAARVAAPDTVLVQGATSAAGLASLQLARYSGVTRVLGTTRSVTKAERLPEFGCDSAIVRGSTRVATAVSELTGGVGADVIIDIVGGLVLQENVDAAAVLGRIVCLGRVSGTEGTLNVDEFSRKRISMTGVTFRTRSLAERIAVVEKFTREVLPAFDSGALQPYYGDAFDLADVPVAEDYIRRGDQFGKVVIDVVSGS